MFSRFSGHTAITLLGRICESMLSVVFQIHNETSLNDQSIGNGTTCCRMSKWQYSVSYLVEEKIVPRGKDCSTRKTMLHHVGRCSKRGHTRPTYSRKHYPRGCPKRRIPRRRIPKRLLSSSETSHRGKHNIPQRFPVNATLDVFPH